MKKLYIAIVLLGIAGNAYCLDCASIFSNTPPLSCEYFSGPELKAENKNILELLKRKIDTSDLNADIDFVRQNQICSDELRAIQDYSSFNYRIYNPALRSQKEDSLDDNYKRDICLISKGLRKMYKFNGPAYRGMALDKAFAEPYLKVGNLIRERAFLSSDTNEAIAIRFSKTNDPAKVRIVLKFIDPVGHAIKQLSLNPIENEVLIDRGHNFMVEFVESRNDGSDYYFIGIRNY
ncbi:MAG: ADP-ribosyltransferase [Elusimicrobiales bacterium]|nr:ADP-ribosyltransferase [Elusimicrobiales bacterium]